MIFFFIPKLPETPDAAFTFVQTAADTVFGKYIDKKNFNPVQVQSQVPYWMQKSQSLMISFLQSYYDWLSEGYGYTGINMMDLTNLSDISEAPEFVLPHYISMYAPDIKGIYEIDENFRPSGDNIKKTISNIRQEIYQRKSNEDAFKSLMVSLFGVTADTINISYPKRKIMRLNGGRLDWMSNSDYYGNTGEYSPERYTVVGSYLNQGVFQDGVMWQDFSYVLTSEIEDSNPYYESVVKETLHPAGLLGMYEKLEKYSEGGYTSQSAAIYESPTVANYKLYTLGSTVSLPICSGCTGSNPSPIFPTPGPVGQRFGSLKLADFRNYIGSNDFIGTSCTLACQATGNVSIEWDIDIDSFKDSILTPIIPFDPDSDGRFGIGGV